MSLGIANIGAYTPSRRAAAVVALRADRVHASVQAADRAEPTAPDTSKSLPAAARSHAASSTVASGAMAALMAAQERAGQSARHGAGEHVAEVLGALLERLADRKPRPHQPPAPPPVTPTPTPAPVFLDSSVRQLQSVLETLHERPVSQFPDVPFSQRQRSFTRTTAQRPNAVNLKTLAAVSQNQAALSILQAMQMSMLQFRAAPSPYAPVSPFQYSRVI